MNPTSSLDLARIFDKLHIHYDAICLFCVSRDSILQLKFPIQDDNLLSSSRQLSWSMALPLVVKSHVCAEDQLMVFTFLQPHNLQAALPAADSAAEIAFRSQNDHWKKLVVHPLSFKNGKADEILYLLIDQTVELNRFDELKALSERDELTYLFNRTKLNQMIETEYADLTSCGVLFFDVNNLKPINDCQGHDAGDRLLQLVAESLRSVVNREVHAFRYGGDEFLVVAPNCTAEHMDTLILMCQNRMRTLSLKQGIEASVAVGKAWSDAGRDINIYNLIRIADREMYINKRITKAQ